jgi:hypothetical protein
MKELKSGALSVGEGSQVGNASGERAEASVYDLCKSGTPDIQYLSRCVDLILLIDSYINNYEHLLIRIPILDAANIPHIGITSRKTIP